MADQNTNEDLLARAQDQYATAGTPVGIGQTLDRGPSAFRDGDLVSRAQEWYGGRNTQGTESGYDTDFFRRSAEGYSRALEEGRARDYWSSKDATGIVTFNFRDDRSGRDFRAGDVYDRGHRVGNLYDSFTKNEADLMMADLTLDATTKARAFSGHAMAGTIGEEVERVRKEQEKEWASYISQLDLQERVEEKKASRGIWDNILAIGAATLAGASTGAVFGPGGAVVGGLLGLVGGVANQDKLTSAAALASVKQDMAHERFGMAAGFTTGLREWSGLAMSYVGGTPTNLVQGTYEIAEGGWSGIADGVSEWDVFDPETGNPKRPGWVTALGFGSQVAGGWGAFASKSSRTAYTTTMQGYVGGSILQPMTTGGNMFNESSGQFESILRGDDGGFSLGRFSSAVGMIGIDAVQLGAFKGLIRKTEDAKALVGARTGQKSLDSLSKGPKAGTYQVQQNGRLFTIDKATGKAVGHRYAAAILAPSELVGALSTRALLWRGRARDAGAITSDDIFRASSALAVGEKRMATVMLNAWGEGMEELTQAVLEARAFGGAMPGAWDLAEAAAGGFAFGLGSGVAMIRGLPTMDKQMFAQAAMNQRVMSGDSFDLKKFEDQWNSLHFEQKRVMAAQSPQEEAQLKAAAAIMARDLTMDVATSTADHSRLLEVLQLEGAARLKTLTSRTDPVLRLVATTTAKQPAHSVQLSIDSTIFQLSQWARGLSIQAKALASTTRGEFIPEEIWADAAGRQQMAAVLNEAVNQLGVLIEQAKAARKRYFDSGKRDVAPLLALNQTIREWYSKSKTQNGLDGLEDAAKELAIRARERAISLVFVRDPQTTSGSYLVLMPQVNLELTRLNGNNGMMISPSLKLLNGMDFDGDNARQLAQLLLTDDALLRFRTGQSMYGATDAVESQVASDGSQLDSPAEVVAEGRLVQVALRGNETHVADIFESITTTASNDQLNQVAKNMVSNIRRALKQRYGKYIPPVKIDQYVNAFRERMLLREEEAVRILISDMMSHQVAMARSSEEGRVDSAGHWQQDTNEVLWMDDMIHRQFEELQTGFATLAQNHVDDSKKDSTLTAAPVNPVLGRYHEIRHQRGVLVAQELMLVFENSTLFRAFGAAKYTSEASNVEGERSLDAVQLELQQMIAALQGEYENTMGMMEDSESIERSVQSMMESIVRQAGLAGPGGVALLGNTFVPENMDSSGGRFDGRITWTQWFLREQINKFQRENQTAIQNNAALQRRLDDLRSLTFPDKREGAALNASKAFGRVFGTWTMHELLGDGAPELGANLTLNQWVQSYALQSEDTRRISSRLLKDDSPLYKKRKDVGDLPFRLDQLQDSDSNGITPYSTIVDVLLDIGNHTLGADADGKPVGERAFQDNRIHTDQLVGMKDFRAALTIASEQVLGRSLKTAEDVRELFNLYPDYALQALRLIPEAAIVGGVYKVVRDQSTGEVTSVVTAPWVHEAFLKTPEEALKDLWWYSTLSSWRALGDQVADYTSLTNRIHQLMWRLSSEPGIGSLRLQKFITEMSQAQTVEAATALLNTKYRTTGDMPYLMWDQEAAGFEPGFSSSAFAGGERSTTLAESAQEFRTKSQEFKSFLDMERVAIAADSVLIADIKSELSEKAKKRAARSQEYQKTGHKTTLDRLELVIDAAKQSGEPLGPSAILDYTSRQLSELSPDSATKGRSARNVVALGDYQAQSSDTVGFDTAYGRHANAISSAYIGDLQSNPKLLLQPLRLQGSDGELLLDWEGISAESIVEAAEKYPALMPIIRAALHPTIQDMVSLPDGSRVLKRRMIGDGSLTSLLDSEYFQKLISDQSVEGKLRYLSEVAVNTRAFGGTGNEVLKMGNEIAVAHAFNRRSTLDSEGARKLAIQTYTDVADLVRIAGIAAGKMTKDENGNVVSVLQFAAENLRKARQEKVAKKLTGTTYLEFAQAALEHASAQVDLAAVRSMRTEAHNLMRDAQEGKDVSKWLEAFQKRFATYRDLQEQVENALELDPFQGILRKFYIESSMTKEEVAQVRGRLVDYIRDNGGIQSQTATWALATVRKVNDHILKERNLPREDRTLPSLSAGDWNTVMSAVLTSAVTNMTTVQADGHQPTPFPSSLKAEMAAAFDPTYMYLVRDLLEQDSPLVQSAKSLQDKYGWTPDSKNWAYELVAKMEQSVFHPDRLGPWTPDIPRHTLENGSSRPASAGAEGGIQQSGLTPHNERTIGTVTEYTYKLPEDSHHSTVTLTANELGSLASIDTLVTAPVKSPTGQDVPMTFPLAELNGRFARRAALNVTLADGTKQTYVLWDGSGVDPDLDTPEGVDPSIGMFPRVLSDPNGPAYPSEFGRSPQKETLKKKGYRIVTLENMKDSVSRVAELVGLPQDATFSLDVEYVHPATQPADSEYFNNIYFEGVPYELGGENFESLNSALHLGPGGLSQIYQDHALDSIKKLFLAIQVTPPPTKEELQAMELGWETDLRAVIHRKATHLMVSDTGGKKLAHHLYPTVFKDQKLTHFVRGFDQDGEPTLWTAEEVIAFQMDNPGAPLPLNNAELYVFSEPGLRKFFGERNSAAARTLPDDPLLSAAGLPKYRGVSSQMLARMPHVLAVDPDRPNEWRRWSVWDIATPLNAFNKEYVKDRKLAPAADPAPFSNAQVRWANRQDAISTARSKLGAEQRGDRERFSRRNIRHAEEILERAAGNILASGDLLPPQTRVLSTLRKKVFSAKAQGFTTDLNSTVVVTLDPTETSQASGVLSEAALEQQVQEAAKPRADHLAPNDLAVVMLSSLDDAIDSGRMPYEQRSAKVRNIMRLLSQTGATIYVVPSLADGDLSVVATRELSQLGYVPVIGASGLYTRADESDENQSTRALQSTLRETTAETIEDTMVLAVIDGFAGTTENSLILLNPDGRERFSATVTVFPTLDYAGFNIPSTPQEVEDVKSAVREMFEDKQAAFDMVDRLVTFTSEARAAKHKGKRKKSGKPKPGELRQLHRAFERMLARWDETEGKQGPASVFHVADQDLRDDDIVPLISNLDGQQKIIFVRGGHQPLSPSELRDQMDLASKEFGLNMAVVPLDRSEGISFRGGKVQYMYSDSRVGVRARIRVPLQAILDKLIDEESAFKFVTTASDVEAKRLPSGEILPGVRLDGVVNTDGEGILNKEMAPMSKASDVFKFVGVEFYSELGRHFFRENMADLSPKEQNALRTRIDNLLLTVKRSSYTADEQLLLDFTRNLTTADTLADALAAINLEGLLPDAWQVDTALAAQGDKVSEQEAIDAQISVAAILYMMLPNSEIAHIMESAGHGHPAVQKLTPAGRGKTVRMPEVFTELFDRARLDSPLRTYIAEKLSAKLGKGFQIHPDYSWSFTGTTVVKRDGKSQEVPYTQTGWLAAPKLVPADDNPALSSQAFPLSRTQQVSIHSAAVASGSAGLFTLYSGDYSPALAEMESRNIIEALTPESILDLFKFAGKEGPVFSMRAEAETHYVSTLAREAMNEFRRPLDKSELDPRELDLYGQSATRIATLLGVETSWLRDGVLDFWIRQNAGTTWDSITWPRMREELELIETNLSKGLLPTIGGSIPFIHAADLMAIYKASIVKGGPFRLKEGLATTAVAGQSFDAWVIAAHNQVMADPGHAEQMHLTAMDGYRHTFATITNALGAIPITIDTMRTTELMDPDSQDLILSIDPNRNIRLSAPVILDGSATTPMEAEIGQDFLYRYTAQPEPDSIRSRRHKEVMAYYKENGIPVPKEQTLKSIRKDGVVLLEQTNAVNTLLRNLTHLRFITAMANPALYPAAVVESWARAATADLATLLTGGSMGLGSGKIAAVSEQLFGDTPMAQEVRDSAKKLFISLGASGDFLSSVYRGISPKHEISATAGRVERGLHRTSAWLGRVMNDPLYGMRQTEAARRYVEAVVRHYAATPGENNMTPERIIAHLATNPTYFEGRDPIAHQAGLNAIADVRSLRKSVASKAINGAIGAFTNSSGIGRQTAGQVLGGWPLMFSTFGANMAIRITGLQGVDAAMAVLLHGRRNPFAKSLAKIRGDIYDPNTPARFDMSDVTVGTDLAEKFMQGAVSHSSLLLLGMILQGFGAAGEDEETRRMRRLANMQGAPFIYDPRAIENDFRNSGAVFLDSLPFGLSALFSVGEGRAMANPHWAIKPFLSPFVGMNKFFDTGDPMQILYGFEDAIGSFPLVNENMYFQGVSAFQELQAASREASTYGNSESLPLSTSLFLSSVMALESMLFESSFINAIYVGMDKLDRDNYKIPALSEGETSGKWARNRLNQPVPTKALETYIDEYGQVMQGYATRDGVEAALHGYAENRLVFSLAMSLFTGQGFNYDESTYNRYNMVPKTRKLQLDELTEMEAKGLIMSQWDERMGREVLTDAGARAVFEGLRAKTVMPDSPSLHGVFIPRDMRERIAAEWAAEIFTEARLQGMSERAAKDLANEIFWGPYGQPEILGLNDIIFSKEISASPTAEYYQLNTTYITGPDGRPWATGVERDNLMNIFLAVPLTRYHTGEGSNLDVDQRLASVDPVAGVNTGLRALTRVEESWEIPTPEQLNRRIESAIEKAAEDINEVLKSEGFPSRGGGGGGGGARSGARITVPRANTPYANDLQRVTVGSPLLRRASVRRERFDSQKGRLKPWQ